MNGNNIFNDNYYDGLDAFSNGSITTNNLTADNNGTWSVSASDPQFGGVGAWLENDFTGSPVAVTLNGINEFNGNYASYWNPAWCGNNPCGGLVVYSNGAIKANQVTASNNVAGDGAVLDNCNDYGSGCTTPSAQNVTLTGVNTFNNNYTSGLGIYSKGVITINNLTANGNTHGFGAQLDNGITGPVYRRL